MLPQFSAAVRVFLCTRPTDLRKGFDGLSGLVQECFGQDPLTGHLFLFLNRRRDRIKILYFDRDGLAMPAHAAKRVWSRPRLRRPPSPTVFPAPASWPASR